MSFMLDKSNLGNKQCLTFKPDLNWESRQDESSRFGSPVCNIHQIYEVSEIVRLLGLKRDL